MPVAPLVAWIQAEVSPDHILAAHALGLDTSHVKRWFDGTTPHVREDLVDRILQAHSVSIDAIYPLENWGG